MTCSFSKEFSSSAFTSVENSFITEYLPLATGNAAKVYLFGLFLCQNSQNDLSLADFAKQINLTEQEVVDCFLFWEEFGIVLVLSKEPFAVQYQPIRKFSSSKPRKYKAEKYSEFTKGLQALFSNRMISTSEYSEYFMIMETFSIKPEAMLMIVNYCIAKKGQDISYRYISKVAKDFGERGITSVEKVEKELSSYSIKTAVIEKILRALSLRRAPDIDDAKLLEKWTGELCFDTENIIFAANSLKKGSMDKLDEFLIELYSMKSFSKQEIAEFMKNKKAVYDLAIKINKALSIYVDVLDTVVDTYTKKWLSFGFDDQTLLFIASHCFKQGKNSLQEMDKIIEDFRMRGLITLSSVGDYFEEQKKTDEFIENLLLTVGLSRKPNPWDRENLNVWKSWNFTPEMILEAGKLASGKSSPIAYVNGILSNWKANNVFNLENISSKETSPLASQSEYNAEYAKRRALALSRAQKNNEKAMAIDGFADVYARLNSIEKDLAFAEIASDSVALSDLEQEKTTLINKAETMLKSIKLTLADLSPVYACKKCNDTGYIGTKRCDCL